LYASEGASLPSLIRYLVDNGLLTNDDLKEVRDSANGFKTRFRLQKYVYFAKFFGYDLGYDYNLYVHGPYSPGLANDYYKISESLDKAEPANINGNYLSLLKGKDDEWLELASTVLMIKHRYEKIGDDELVELTRSAKPWAAEERIKGILSELRSYKLA